MRTQQQTSYSGTNLDGYFVLYTQGYEYSGGSVSGFDLGLSGTGNGASSNFTVNSYYQDADGTYQEGQCGWRHGHRYVRLADPGRATSFLGDSLYLYFFLQQCLQAEICMAAAIRATWILAGWSRSLKPPSPMRQWPATTWLDNCR